MKRICKSCYDSATGTNTLDAVKLLLKHERYVCPQLNRNCGNTADFVDAPRPEPLSSFAKICDVFFNGRKA